MSQSSVKRRTHQIGKRKTYMSRYVNIVDVAIVQVDGMEALAGTIDHFEANALLDGHVHEKRFVHKVGKRLESHELVIRFRRPGIDFD